MSAVPFVALGSTAQIPDLIYATKFEAPDPVAIIRHSDGTTQLLVNRMEFGRALKQARGCVVCSAKSLGITSVDAEQSESALLAYALKQQSIQVVEADALFPLGAVRQLEANGIEVRLTNKSPYADARLIKTPEEIAFIRHSQDAARAAESALKEALDATTIASDGSLELDGELFTSQRAKNLVRRILLEHGTMDLEGSIVAGGVQATDPHESGHGPLRAGEWIVADIFPRDLQTLYWGDMTRTFMRGTPTPEQARLFEAVRTAQLTALSLLRPGVDGRTVHQKVIDHFENLGYKTGTALDGSAYGYFHGTGHGVGLEIHEQPRLSHSGGILEEGMVVTVEPGLYYPQIGGVRIEDTVAITSDGCEIL